MEATGALKADIVIYKNTVGFMTSVAFEQRIWLNNRYVNW